MNNTEIEKSKTHVIVEITEYVPHSVVSKTIINKSTGSVSVMSFDSGQVINRKTSAFDTFVQIIDGKGEIQIDGRTYLLETGDAIIIPAHTPNAVKANERCKMILTIIKSGYE